MIRLSNTSMDSGMVLLEQTWVMVFLLGDKLEDLEIEAMTKGERELAREVFGEVVESAVVKQNSLKRNLVGIEARLLGSILKVQVG